VEAGDLAIVQLLVEAGADVNSRDQVCMVSRHGKYTIETNHFVLKPVLLSLQFGYSVLAGGAARKGHFEVAKYLVSKGADVHARNSVRFLDV
jgi:ankyrin repeat protein